MDWDIYRLMTHPRMQLKPGDFELMSILDVWEANCVLDALDHVEAMAYAQRPK